jgi:hypothetical protein
MGFCFIKNEYPTVGRKVLIIKFCEANRVVFFVGCEAMANKKYYPKRVEGKILFPFGQGWGSSYFA